MPDATRAGGWPVTLFTSTFMGWHMSFLRTGRAFLAAGLLLVVASTVSPRAGAAGGESYVVASGDSLSRLAQAQFADATAWPAIWLATNHRAETDAAYATIDDPDDIWVGQRLWLPDRSELAALLAEYRDHGAGHADAHEAPHWSYRGETGPDRWAQLDRDFAACAEGPQQSPVDLTGARQQALSAIRFHYAATPGVVTNNGHTIQVNLDEGSYIELDGRRYDLRQFHFHTPSEHTVEGRYAALELHLVHQAGQGGPLAVIGLLLTEGSEHLALRSVWADLPRREGAQLVLPTAFDPATLLPGDLHTFRYAGSLTTPPCSEGVSWLVLATPREVSGDQVAAFRAIFDYNSRPIQPTNGRLIVTDLGQ